MKEFLDTFLDRLELLDKYCDEQEDCESCELYYSKFCYLFSDGDAAKVIKNEYPKVKEVLEKWAKEHVDAGDVYPTWLEWIMSTVRVYDRIPPEIAKTIGVKPIIKR